MRHQCSSCLGEFSDDAPSSSAPARVFCVFCGTELPVPPVADSRAAPFSVEHPREEAVALGVIGGARSGFPDTLRQFRAPGAPGALDSLSPVHTESEETTGPLAPPARRLGRFGASLAVGFAVGAGAAVLFARDPAPRPTAAAPAPPRVAPPVAPAAPPLALSGCATAVVSPAPAAPSVEPKSPVTPQLEKRFWVDRARSAQRQYRLGDAERFYRRALFHAPHDSEALAGLGELELLRGQRSAASARFREALEANADYVPARVALADLHWQAGQGEVARREYRDIVEQYSADLFPPYVSQRLEGDACVPQCVDASASAVPPSLIP